jgi:methylmalonyl-CoA/ethylmalonyl-CoA epimerase
VGETTIRFRVATVSEDIREDQAHRARRRGGAGYRSEQAVVEDCFGIPLGSVEEDARWRLALYPVGESMIELISGTTPDGKHARMVAEGKGGLNHICFEVENIDEALAELKAKGIPLLDEVPRIGHAGCKIAFLDPKATENCLIELAELPAGHS